MYNLCGWKVLNNCVYVLKTKKERTWKHWTKKIILCSLARRCWSATGRRCATASIRSPYRQQQKSITRIYAESSIRSLYRYEFVMALSWHPFYWLSALYACLSRMYQLNGACIDLVLYSRLSGVCVLIVNDTFYLNGRYLALLSHVIIIHSLDISLALSWGLVHRIWPHRPLLIEKASSYGKGLSLIE